MTATPLRKPTRHFRLLEVAALPFPSHQGTQAFLREQCEALARRGHEIHLLTYAHGAYEYEPRYSLHRLPDWPRDRSLQSGPSWQKCVLDLRLVQAVRRLARELKPQAVHAHNYEALAACLLARPGPPVVYHAHTLFGHELPCFFDHPAARALAKALGAGADQFLPPLAAMTLAISPRLVEELLELGHDPQRVGCVLPGIDLPPLAKPLPPLTTGGEKIVGYCGNLDRYQDLETLLDAMVLLCRRRRPVRLALVTASPPERLAEALRSRGLQKQVIFLPHGSFDNALAQLRRLDLCVLPRAIPGGFPIKLLAYLAAERPVISTIAGTAGLPLGDLVEVVNEGDASQLAAAIGHLLDHLDEARKRARRGRAFVEEEFSWDRSAAQLETHLARL